MTVASKKSSGPGRKVPEPLWQNSQRAIAIAVGSFILGVVLSCLPYAVLITDSWIQSVGEKCDSHPDLCVSVESEVRYVRGWWRGRVFFFTARSGKQDALRSLIRQGCPEGHLNQIRSPCYFSGFAFAEEEPG